MEKESRGEITLGTVAMASSQSMLAAKASEKSYKKESSLTTFNPMCPDRVRP